MGDEENRIVNTAGFELGSENGSRTFVERIFVLTVLLDPRVGGTMNDHSRFLSVSGFL